MTKLKEKLYVHRFGLFFFGFLLVYSFFVSGDMRPWKINDVTYSVYAVDFSMGFCTKILPGAIYNFIFDKASENIITSYSIVLLVFFFVGVSALLEKLIMMTEEGKRKYIIGFVMFFLTGPCTFSLSVTTLGFLDFYWLLGVLIFFFCLSKTQLYIFLIPIFLYMIMIYYSSIICYVPFFVIIVLYKISCTEKKKEKYYLMAILGVAFILMMLLFFYMIFFETNNLTYSIEEFHSILNDRGVTQFNYYEFSFYRRTIDTTFEEFYGDRFNNAIIEIDRTGSPVKAFIQTIIQQIQIHIILRDMKSDIKFFVLILPVSLLIFRIYFSWIKKNKDNKLKSFSLLCSIALFFTTIALGNLFSTDAVRWFAYAYMPLMAGFLYVWWTESAFREEVKIFVSEMDILWVLPYFFIYAATITSF